MALRLHLLLVTLLGAATLMLAPAAAARGGSYVVDGGTAAERSQVADALSASTFDWSLVPVQVKIHVARGINSHAQAGEIWLDANLLDSGRFAWGVVQHEYAHQVDFFLLDDQMRAQLSAALGAGVTPETVDHAAIERVAAWLGDLQPPRSPHQVDPGAAERGRAIYMNGH